MAQIRKGFIASNAIDGTKLKLLNNDAIRAANADGTDAELMKLDASNVLQFLKLPQVSSDPSVANDLARKSYVDNKVDTAKGDVDAALASETAAREAADSGLQSAIDTEVSGRQAAVSAEASARQTADAGLQSAIDTEKGRIDAILTAATADADSFAEIVNLINSVDTENDSAFASYVLSNDAALASETSSRQSADSTLQSNIDSEASARAAAVSAEQSARESADSTLQSNIDSEAAARQSADSDLQDGLDQEVADRQAAVSAEQSARETADQDLQDQIDALDSSSSAALAQEVSDRQAAVSAESAAREAADSALQSSLDQEVADRTAAVSSVQAAVDQEVADRTAAVSAESSARQSADATLQSNIDTEKARIDAILTAATADADSFAEIVNLINSVDTENDNAFASYVLSNDAALAQEVSDRQAAVSAEQSAREAADSAESAARSAADQDLQDQIDALDSGSNAALTQEIADRTAADAELASDIADEASARQSADTTLQSNIDSEVSARQAAVSAEQSAREAADSAETSARQAADSTLQSNIDSEASARQAADASETAAREAADSALDVRVDALEAVTHQKAKFTLTYMDIMSGYVELAHNAIVNSELVFVGSLYLHDGDHYTTSAGMSGTRLTWTGDVANGGASQLVEGDTVYVRYQASTGTGGGGGGGGGGGEPSYSFPMIIGVTDNGDGTTNINWSGATLPNAGVDLVYLVPAVGPGMYDDSAKVGLSMGMSSSVSITTPASGTYVLKVYDAMGATQVTSASFQITNNALTQDGLGEGVGYISGTPVTGLTRLTVGTGSAVADIFSETTFFGYHLFGGTFSQTEIDEFTATGSIAGATSWVGNGNPEHTWSEVPSSGNYGGAMLGAKQGEARVFFWQGRHILARIVTP
jgi:hypothetical protein